MLDNQSRDLLHVDHGKTIFLKPKLIRVLPSAIDIALTNSSTYTKHIVLHARTFTKWKHKYFEQFESELLMSLTIFGGYAHVCVSKYRFITFKVKEDVRALLGGTCTYEQEPSFEADNR